METFYFGVYSTRAALKMFLGEAWKNTFSVDISYPLPARKEEHYVISIFYENVYLCTLKMVRNVDGMFVKPIDGWIKGKFMG